MQLQPTDCARAREFVSAQLDGELAEPELDYLELHLLGCPACTTWAQEVRDVTRRLREAPLEEPAAGRFVLPRLRRSWRVSSAVAVASAAAVVATVFVAPAQHGSVASRVNGPLESRFGTQHLVVSRLLRLEDGVYYPISTANASRVNFRHV